MISFMNVDHVSAALRNRHSQTEAFSCVTQALNLVSSMMAGGLALPCVPVCEAAAKMKVLYCL
jgi:hypothetical protein